MYRIDWTKAIIIAIVAMLGGLLCWWAIVINASFDKILAIVSACTAMAAFLIANLLTTNTDVAKIKLYRMAFDRPAFRTSFVNEISEEDFIKVVHQTLETINTGILRDRTGSVIHRIDLGGKGGLEKWGREMDEVAVALEQMMRRYQAGIAEKKFRQFEYEGKFILPEVDKPFGDHMDDLKIATLEKMNVVLAKAKLDPLSVELDRDVWRPRNPSKPPS